MLCYGKTVGEKSERETGFRYVYHAYVHILFGDLNSPGFATKLGIETW